MLPEITGAGAKKFFDDLNIGKFQMEDVAEHVDRENIKLKEILGSIAYQIVHEEDLPEKKDFHVKSFIEGMLLTYGILQYQSAINKDEDPGFTRPDRFWDGNEWFS
jgi:hypothetical protein